MNRTHGPPTRATDTNLWNIQRQIDAGAMSPDAAGHAIIQIPTFTAGAGPDILAA